MATTTSSSTESGTTSGEFDTEETSSFRTSPTVPQEWIDAWTRGQPGGGTMNPFIERILEASSGIEGAAGGVRDAAGGIRGAAGGIGEIARTGYDDIDRRGGQLGDFFRDQQSVGAHTLQMMAEKYPELYGEQPSVEAALVRGVDDVTARTGASFMDAYTNPFEQQVVQSALNDLEKQFGRNQTAGNMQQSMSGAFGGGRHALRESEAADSYLDTIGRTSGGLRSDNFARAIQAGQFDAELGLQGQRYNQMTELERAMLDARNKQEASRINAEILQERQLADQRAAQLGDTNRLEAGIQSRGLLSDLAGRNLDKAELYRAQGELSGREGELRGLEGGLTKEAAALAGAAAGLSTLEFDQLMEWLSQGTSQFGTEGIAEGTTSGTSAGEYSGQTDSTSKTKAGLFDWVGMALGAVGNAASGTNFAGSD